MRNDWFDKLENRMEDYQESAPEGLWDEIEASLPESRNVITWGRVWKAASIAAAVAVGVFATVKLTDSGTGTSYNNTGENIVAVKTSEAPAPEITVIPGPEQMSKEVQEPARKEVRQQPVKVQDKEEMNMLVAATQEMPQQEKEQQPEEQQQSSYEKPSEPVSDEAFSYNEQETSETAEFLRQAEQEFRSKNTEKNPVSVHFSVDANATESSSSGSLDTRAFSANRFLFSGDNPDIITKAQAGQHHEDDIYDKSNHKKPVRMGVSLNLPLSKVFGIGSGVTYSILNSSFSTSSSGNEVENSQRLHYVGIPLNVTANILNRKFFRAYAYAGGMGEKCVAGNVTTSVYDNNEGRIRTTKRDVDVKGLEWSLNAGAGLQFNITDFMGIYAEPGLSYHFNNKSNVTNIYTVHPFDFVLNFGISFTFSNPKANI